jgi:AcrR family transcriptional regulator
MGSADVRCSILRAAAEQLQRYGLLKLTMEDIARSAGLSRQTVYRYMGSKDDVLVALFVKQISDNQHPAMRALAAQSPASPESLTDLILAELRLARQFSLFEEVLDPAVAPRMAELVFRSAAMDQVSETFWVPLLASYQEQGVVRAGLDLRAATRWIIYQQFWLLTHPGTLCDDEALPAYVRDFVTAAMVTSATPPARILPSREPENAPA